MTPETIGTSIRLFILLFSLMIALAVSACGTLLESQPGSVLSSRDQGGSETLIHLPVEQGRELMCTQGAHGSYSHQRVSTRYDIDLDTSNSVQEEVFAPVSGVARVHMDSATSGFGYHVNIDRGDGTYVVIGHLDDIFLSDGDDVVQGQLMAYEGCTGDCSGDHIHLGLHAGDASEGAHLGESIPATFIAANATQRGMVGRIESEAFTCGIAREGDAQDGHFYRSDLPINLWHPDGVLVKTPGNARVYVLENGQTRWIENESTFWESGWDFSDVVLISESELACYGEGEDVRGEGFVDAAFDEEGQLWLVYGALNDPNRFRARVRGTGWEAVLQSWGLSYGTDDWPDTYGADASFWVDWPPSAEYVGMRDGTLVREHDASDVWMISGTMALPIVTWDVYLLQHYLDHQLFTVPDGTVGELHRVGSCATDQYCLDHTAVTTCGGGMDLSSSYGSGGSYNDTPSDEPDDDPVEEEEEHEQEPESQEDPGDTSLLWVWVQYPDAYPELELTVQPVFSASALGQRWYDSTSELSDSEVQWDEFGNWQGLLGLRLNVNVDATGNGRFDDWSCYGHYETALLASEVQVREGLDSTLWDQDALVAWSPGSASETELGCSALLWFSDPSDIPVGFVTE